MFSSNQKLEISGDYNQLKSALEFAIKYDGTDPNNLCYQTTDDGKYCLGWFCDKPSSGWEKFQFDFDIDIVSKIIIQFLSKQKQEEIPIFDGGTDEGFIMEAISETFSDFRNGIRNPFYGIVCFKPFTCFYSK